jgi:hypothetical protein
VTVVASFRFLVLTSRLLSAMSLVNASTHADSAFDTIPVMQVNSPWES